MGEKIYSTMRSVGIINLVLGIVITLVGIGTGTAVIISGARLLKNKSDLLF